jgi:hypothetical protein
MLNMAGRNDIRARLFMVPLRFAARSAAISDNQRVPYDTEVFGICHFSPIQNATLFRAEPSDRLHGNPPKSPHFALMAMYIF